MRVWLTFAALVFLAVMVSGCAAFRAPLPKAEWSRMTVHYSLTNSLPFNVNGRATIRNGECYVELRASDYPRCMLHETLHCFGWTHSDAPNEEYCRVE